MPIEELGLDHEVMAAANPGPPGASPHSADSTKSAKSAKTAKTARKMRLPISGNNLVLAAMAISGVAAVYILKLSVKPEAASAKQREDEIKVEAAIAQLAVPSAKSPEAGTAGSIVNTLHNDTQDRQIPAWLVTRNPFVFKPPKPKTTPKSPSEAGTDGAAAMGRKTAAEQLRSKALADAQRLELQTILMVAKPMAMVSGRAVVKGERINGWTVQAIEPMRVVFTWRDKDGKTELKHVLAMEDRQPG